MGELVNVSRQTLSKWEKGIGNGPSVYDLLKLCQVFDCDYGYLVGEYQTRHKVAADIQAVTGLSELAIKKLSFTKALDGDFSALISVFITNPYFLAAMQDFDRAMRINAECKKRDTIKQNKDKELAASGVPYDDRHEELGLLHAAADGIIQERHHIPERLSPDHVARVYLRDAKDHLAAVLDDMAKRKEAPDNGKH